MPFKVVPVTEADIPTLVDVYFTTFKSPLVRRLKPNVPSVRAWYQKSLESAFAKPYTRFYKVVEEAGGEEAAPVSSTSEIIAFAQWTAPHHEPSTPTAWPAEGDPAAFDDIAKQAAAKRKALLGDEDHWYLAALATLPQHQRRGAATLLMTEFCRQVDASGQRAYIESSAVGRPTYERFGFATKDSFGVELDGVAVTDYCMLRDPRSK